MGLVINNSILYQFLQIEKFWREEETEKKNTPEALTTNGKTIDGVNGIV